MQNFVQADDLVEVRKERPATGQKCLRSTLASHGSNFDRQVAERPNTGQKCPRQRNKSVPAQKSQMCPGRQTKEEELQAAKRKIA